MEHKIHGPAEGMKHAGVTDVDSYLSLHRNVLQEQQRVPQENSQERVAYVNHGRWVVDCNTDCHGAGLTSPTFNVSVCFDCGTVYTNIVFPDNAAAIEAVLLKRPDMVHRNWSRPETIELLETENVTHLMKDNDQ